MISTDHYDEFHVNFIFDRSIYRPMCTHMGHCLNQKSRVEELNLRIGDFSEEGLDSGGPTRG